MTLTFDMGTADKLRSEGKSLRAIAKQLGVSKSTVHNRFAAKAQPGTALAPNPNTFNPLTQAHALKQPENTRLPPGGGREMVPSYLQYSGIWKAGNGYYLPWDQAIVEGGRSNARAMYNSLIIREPLQARLWTASEQKWHIEPYDKKDPKQIEVATQIQRIIEEIPDFLKLRYSLLKSRWFGVYGAQLQYTWDADRMLRVKKWTELHGDSLNFKQANETVGVYVAASGWYDRKVKSEAGYVGRVHPFDDSEVDEDKSGTDAIVYDDYGNEIRFDQDGKPYQPLSFHERQAVIICSYDPQAADFLDPRYAGGIKGTGLRSTLYPTWLQMTEIIGWMVDWLERFGTGVTLYRFLRGDVESYNAARQLAESQDINAAIMMPVDVSTGTVVEGISREEPSPAGLDNVLKVIEFFEQQIRRMIVGQDATSQPMNAGLGSEISEVQESTFARIIEFDCVDLQETLTHQLVKVIQEWSFPGTPPCKFVIDYAKPNTKEQLENAKAAYEMGVSLIEDEVRSLVGLSKPTTEDKVLSKSAEMQQQQQGDLVAQQQKTKADIAGQQMKQHQDMKFAEQKQNHDLSMMDRKANVEHHFAEQEAAHQLTALQQKQQHDLLALKAKQKNELMRDQVKFANDKHDAESGQFAPKGGGGGTKLPKGKPNWWESPEANPIAKPGEPVNFKPLKDLQALERTPGQGMNPSNFPKPPVIQGMPKSHAGMPPYGDDGESPVVADDFFPQGEAEGPPTHDYLPGGDVGPRTPTVEARPSAEELALGDVPAPDEGPPTDKVAPGPNLHELELEDQTVIPEGPPKTPSNLRRRDEFKFANENHDAKDGRFAPKGGGQKNQNVKAGEPKQPQRPERTDLDIRKHDSGLNVPPHLDIEKKGIAPTLSQIVNGHPSDAQRRQKIDAYDRVEEGARWNKLGRHLLSEGEEREQASQDKPRNYAEDSKYAEFFRILGGEQPQKFSTKWDESSHSRDDDGKFKPDGGSSKRPKDRQNPDEGKKAPSHGKDKTGQPSDDEVSDIAKQWRESIENRKKDAPKNKPFDELSEDELGDLSLDEINDMIAKEEANKKPSEPGPSKVSAQDNWFEDLKDDGYDLLDELKQEPEANPGYEWDDEDENDTDLEPDDTQTEFAYAKLRSSFGIK